MHNGEFIVQLRPADMSYNLFCKEGAPAFIVNRPWFLSSINLVIWHQLITSRLGESITDLGAKILDLESR